MTRHAIVTGAGSGVGQAVTLALLERGWSVSILGRRAEALHETVTKAGDAAPRVDSYPLDVADTAAVERAVATMLGKHGAVQAAVNSAGTNIKRRALSELSHDDWRAVLDVNLNGAYNVISAVLPAMRRAGSGTIVNILSEAGWRANTKAGAAYITSKFALSGLTQAVNREEQKHGIRATALYPGDINTSLLDKRPVPPPAETRVHMLQAADVAACALLAIELPYNAVVEELLLTPRMTE
jgi:NAD(P)-dependent dehydrogenase (short-subunit alcohol dehydrogenase family)